MRRTLACDQVIPDAVVRRFVLYDKNRPPRPFCERLQSSGAPVSLPVILIAEDQYGCAPSVETAIFA
jgi:hypothetical protein